MTESDWLTATDPTPMLAFLRGKASDRKLWLVVCACFRRGWDRLDAGPRQWIEDIEAYLEGSGQADAVQIGDRPADPFHLAECVTGGSAVLHRCGIEMTDLHRRLMREKCPLLRDIFGNPFRPVAIDPSWLTTDVVALAGGVYADRAFDRLPILADALQDAGCDNTDVLAHCRGPGPHVRGCWAVDLLLGKT